MSKRDQLDLLPKVAAAFKYVAEEDEDVVGVTVTTAVSYTHLDVYKRQPHKRPTHL